jgi:hypothetical protein
VTIVNNTTTITNITIYKNVTAPGAVNGISHGDFAGGRFNRVTRVTPIEMRRAVPVNGVLPVVPTTANLRLSDRPVVRREGAVPVEQHFARFAAPRSSARPFSVQRDEAQAAAQRRYPSHATEILHESQAPVVKATPPAGVIDENANAQHSPAWRRFDEQRGLPVRRSPPATASPVHSIDGLAPVRMPHAPDAPAGTAHPEALHTETPRPIPHTETPRPEVWRGAPVHIRVPRGETEPLRGETPHPRVLPTGAANPEVLRAEPVHTRIPGNQTELLRSETPHPRILRSETAPPVHLRGTAEPAPHPTSTHVTRRRPNGGHAEAEERATPR